MWLKRGEQRIGKQDTVVCLTEYRGSAWILEYREVAREKVHGGVSNPSQALTTLLRRAAAEETQQ